MAMLSCRAQAARVARLEVQRTIGASGAEKEAAIAAHLAASGWLGPVMEQAEWEVHYG